LGGGKRGTCCEKKNILRLESFRRMPRRKKRGKKGPPKKGPTGLRRFNPLGGGKEIKGVSGNPEKGGLAPGGGEEKAPSSWVGKKKESFLQPNLKREKKRPLEGKDSGDDTFVGKEGWDQGWV